MTKFIVTAQPRTGTTLMVNALGNLPEVKMLGEVYNSRPGIVRRKQHPALERQKKLNLAHNLWHWYHDNIDSDIPKDIRKLCTDDILKSYLDWVFSQGDVVGFKLLHPHAKEMPYIRQYIKENDIKKIVMKRRNPLKQVLSADRVPFDGRFECNIENVIKRVRRNEEKTKEMEKWFENGQFMVLYYEDMTENQNINKIKDNIVESIYTFLCLPYRGQEAIIEFPKNAPDKISDRITNIREFTEYVEKEAPEYKEFID